MRSYKLYEVLPHVLPFLELPTNWCVRMNRGRLKGYEGDAEQSAVIEMVRVSTRKPVKEVVVIHRACRISRSCSTTSSVSSTRSA